MKAITTKRFKKIVIAVIERMFYYPNNRHRFFTIPEIKKLLKESDDFRKQVEKTQCFSYDEFVMRLGWTMMGNNLITAEDIEAWKELMNNNKPLYNKTMTFREVIEQTIKEEIFCD